MKKNGLYMCYTSRMCCCCSVIYMMGRRSENDKQHIYNNKRYRTNEKDIIHHSIYLAVAS